jgi:outer membrane assembly lipoprotein YfiO
LVRGRRFLGIGTIVLGAVAVLGGLLAGPGCGTGNPYPPGSFDRGAEFHRRNKHHEAVDAFEAFVRRNPTDSLAARAQYLKALSYMEIKEYPLAAVELQILRKDYPTSLLLEDADFQEGVAHFRQVGRVERDLSGAEEARIHFRRFLNTFPDSKYRDQVLDYLEEISDLFVRKRLRAADVYQHLGRHEAVALVLDATLVEEPQSSLLDQVLFLRARNAVKLGDVEVAETCYQRIVQEYPDSSLAERAASGLANLTAIEDP